jgi:activator of Hsp90 ATPase-like protein
MSTSEALAAIHKSVRVEASVETAFETFTSGIGGWWPRTTHTVFEDQMEEIVVEERAGGRVYERSVNGQEADWADVAVWEPPDRLVLRWRVNPRRGPTEVEVRFIAEDGLTRVELEHRGWDRIGDEAGRAEYDPGWDRVVGRFADAFAAG